MATSALSAQADSVPRSPHSTVPVVKIDTQQAHTHRPSRHSPDVSPGDPMEVTSPSPAVMGPPVHTSPELDPTKSNSARRGSISEGGNMLNGITGGQPGIGAAAAAASAQQPKVVQTAFIHKLYNMLEDQNIQHLISWSSSNEGFVMSPSGDFAKVLAQYFKHTNISSFVRQLNMYGFHKVSDVFHTASPESPLWEFKHGNGNFKRGDLVGLREIKRRASRHALIHRDSFSSGPKSNMPQQPGALAEPSIPEPADSRITNLEHTIYDIHTRLLRSEEANATLSLKFQSLLEGLVRCHQWNNDLSQFVIAAYPDPENPMRRDVSAMQKDIHRQTEQLKSLEESHDMIQTGRQPYFSNLTIDSAPLSPRQSTLDDPRRGAPQGIARQNYYRPPAPSHANLSPRRYGSVGTAHQTPAYRPQPTHPPAVPHPLASVVEPPPNIPRRHTSADIRQHGWQAQGPPPFGAGQASGSQWPPSPNRASIAGESSQDVRDVLARYEIAPARPFGSRQTTPPLTSDTTPSTTSAESGWSFGVPKFAAKAADSSGPQTRRSSMASNVHSLLNPAETAEKDEDEAFNDDRKRKRLQ